MKDDIQHILEKYSRNACTEEELRSLEAWYLKIGREKPGTLADEARLEHILQRVQASQRYLPIIPQPDAKHARLRRILAIASVAALLLLGIGLTVYLPEISMPIKELTAADIVAGEEKAILTLANGRQIVLDSLARGILTAENGISIHKNADGVLTYTLQATTDQLTGQPVYNTIETPRGGQYQVVLSDGSSVWLNAASSLTFPTRFSANSRQVSVRGEAYFSVVPHQTQAGRRTPFIVETDQQRIEVLGTEFNVNTYPDQYQQRTTLVEGSVRVIDQHSGKQVLLERGQQVRTGSSMEIVQADIEKEIAWKQGDFIFKDDQLSDILQQVSRWYDIPVSYPRHLAELRYSGMVSRKRPLSGIVSMLESTGTIKVKIKERRIIIE